MFWFILFIQYKIIYIPFIFHLALYLHSNNGSWSLYYDSFPELNPYNILCVIWAEKLMQYFATKLQN